MCLCMLSQQKHVSTQGLQKVEPQRESFLAFRAQVSFTDPSSSVWSYPFQPQEIFFSLQLDITLQDAERRGGGKVCSIVPLLYLFLLSRASLTSELRTFWLGMDPTPSHHPPQLLSGSSSVVSFSGASLSFCGSGPSSAS